MRAGLRRRRNATGTPALLEAAAGCPVQSGRPGCRFLPALSIASVSVYASFSAERTPCFCGPYATRAGANNPERARSGCQQRSNSDTPGLAVAYAARDKESQ